MATGRERARTFGNLAAGTAFAVVLAFPALDTLLGIDRTPPPQEKRQLAARPGAPHSSNALASFPGAFDAYVSDHFGFRSLLVRLEARVAVLWLGVPPSPKVNVMVGRNGWLFFTGDQTIPYIEGTNLFGEAELRAWSVSLRQRNDWLARRGIRYLVVFAPGSPSIYPEFLPRWVRPSTRGTRLDQLMAAMSSHPEVAVLDLRPSLVEVKKLAVVYSPTDTHWNNLGSWAAYRAIMGRLSAWFPAAHVSPFDTFNVAWADGGGGDLAMMADIQGMIKEPMAWMAPKQGFQARATHASDYDALRPWPRGMEPVITERRDAQIPRAVVFRDSFSMSVAPFLSEHFGRAVYLWIPEFEPSVIEREKPDLVIQEYAERLLSVVNPANPPALAAESTNGSGG